MKLFSVFISITIFCISINGSAFSWKKGDSFYCATQEQDLPSINFLITALETNVGFMGRSSIYSIAGEIKDAQKNIIHTFNTAESFMNQSPKVMGNGSIEISMSEGAPHVTYLSTVLIPQNEYSSGYNSWAIFYAVDHQFQNLNCKLNQIY